LSPGEIKGQTNDSITQLTVIIHHHDARQFIGHLLLGSRSPVPVNRLA
jgi:hypothetical protein